MKKLKRVNIRQRKLLQMKTKMIVAGILLILIATTSFLAIRSVNQRKEKEYIATLNVAQVTNQGNNQFQLIQQEGYFYQQNHLTVQQDYINQWLNKQYQIIEKDFFENITHEKKPLEEKPIYRLENYVEQITDNAINAKIVLSKDNQVIAENGQLFDSRFKRPFELAELMLNADEKENAIGFSYLDNQLTVFDTYQSKQNIDSANTKREIINNRLSIKSDLANNPQYKPYKAIKEKLVAFTFDDGPHPTYDKELVDLFKKYDGKATFFWVGQQLENGRADTIKYVLDNGFEVGSHSYDHQDFTTLSKDQIINQFTQTNNLIKPYKADGFKMFRPPYGSVNQQVLDLHNGPVINWSVDSLDWKSRNTQQIYDEISNHIFDGSIVLMHSLYPTSIEAVKELLPVLYEQGYRFVTVSELFEYFNMPLQDHKLYLSPIYQ